MVVILALEDAHGYWALGPLGRRNWSMGLVKDHGYKEFEHDVPRGINCV